MSVYESVYSIIMYMTLRAFHCVVPPHYGESRASLFWLHSLMRIRFTFPTFLKLSWQPPSASLAPVGATGQRSGQLLGDLIQECL